MVVNDGPVREEAMASWLLIPSSIQDDKPRDGLNDGSDTEAHYQGKSKNMVGDTELSP